MKAEEFDRKFNNNEDIMEYLDLSLARRPQYQPQAVTLDQRLPELLRTGAFR